MTDTTAGDDRLTVLLGQLDAAWEMLEGRLTGRRPFSGDPHREETDLTDEEYFWEPAASCWSLRRRGEANSPNPRGRGEWLLDGGQPESNPPPFTTIAWRIGHICESPLYRYNYTFGDHSLGRDDITWPATAQDAYAFLKDTHLRWRTALDGITTADLDQIGRSQYPGGLDPQVRFVDLLAWTNLEFGHHAAEIACLRDLYRARSGQSI